MNANAIAKTYARLTPEERFRLILAASGRGDEAERDRLTHAGERITLSMPDHSPYARAFAELADLIFIELVEAASHYHDAFYRADENRDHFGDGDAEEEGDDAKAEPAARTDLATEEDDTDKQPAWLRSFDIALAAGFLLKTKADGWKLFCERLNVPPLLLWEGLPGFDRLQRALALTEKAAFFPEGFLRWLNDIRPAGAPKATEVNLTVNGIADGTASMFKSRVEWWGG